MADTKQATAETVCKHCGLEIWNKFDGLNGSHWRTKSTGEFCIKSADGHAPRTQPSQTELAPPHHAFEVRITIGGNDWDYVLRTMDELAVHVREHGLECGLSSGGWGGSHSVDIEKRDVTPEVYRDELEKWRIARLEGSR